MPHNWTATWDRERASVDGRWRRALGLIQERDQDFPARAPRCVWCQVHPATIAGHLIPHICFLESGLPAASSYYEGNILPTCHDCNVAWWDWARSKDLMSRWSAGQNAHWRRKLREAVRRAHARGILVYLSAQADPLIGSKIRRQRWSDPGVDRLVAPSPNGPFPVIAPPENRDALYLEIVGYLRRQRNHPFVDRVAGFGSRPRLRLRDLAGESVETLEQYFVLNEPAIRFLQQRARPR